MSFKCKLIVEIYSAMVLYPPSAVIWPPGRQVFPCMLGGGLHESLPNLLHPPPPPPTECYHIKSSMLSKRLKNKRDYREYGLVNWFTCVILRLPPFYYKELSIPTSFTLIVSTLALNLGSKIILHTVLILQ